MRAVALRADPASPEVGEALAPLVPCLARGLSLARQTDVFAGAGASAESTTGADFDLLRDVMSALGAMSTILDISVVVANNSAVVQALVGLMEEPPTNVDADDGASVGAGARPHAHAHAAAEVGSGSEWDSEESVEGLVAQMEELTLSRTLGESLRSEAVDVLLSCAATPEGAAGLLKERVFGRVAALILAHPGDLVFVDQGCQLYNAWLDAVSLGPAPPTTYRLLPTHPSRVRRIHTHIRPPSPATPHSPPTAHSRRRATEPATRCHRHRSPTRTTWPRRWRGCSKPTRGRRARTTRCARRCSRG